MAEEEVKAPSGRAQLKKSDKTIFAGIKVHRRPSTPFTFFGSRKALENQEMKSKVR